VIFPTLKRNSRITIFFLFNLAFYIPAFASIGPIQEGPSNDEQVQEQQELQTSEIYELQIFEFEDRVIEVDTLDVPETSSRDGESTEKAINSKEIPASTGSGEYYDEEEESTSESVISFNFLYFLLQKFRFSDSMSY